jgi:hypothetical protein
MQIFELYFNPKADKEKIFSTFVHEPENVYEKRLGGLYVLGELKHPLLGKGNLLNDLSLAVKNEYYSSGLKMTPDASFKKALKAGNEYLDNQKKKGNVEWLGNLNFAILSYNDQNLNFSKTGDIKIILIRGKEFSDIGESIEQENPYGIFENIASGKLASKDKVIVATCDAFSILSKNKPFLNSLSKAENEKELKEMIKQSKALFSQITGACLIIIASENLQPKRALTFKKELPEFSFKQSFLEPLASMKIKAPVFKKIYLPKMRPMLPKPKLPLFFPLPKIKKLIDKRSFTLPKIHFPKPNSKKFLLVIFLLLLFFSFFLIFKKGEIKESRDITKELQEANEKIMMAENFLIIRKMEEAKNLFQESLDIISPLIEINSPLKEEALILEERARTQLDSILKQ